MSPNFVVLFAKKNFVILEKYLNFGILQHKQLLTSGQIIFKKS